VSAALSTRPVLLWSGLALIAACLSIYILWSAFAGFELADAPSDIETVIFWHSLLPRTGIALVAGAALGLSGALLQRVLRNPLAEPSTLGISAGAQLALAAATLYAPFLMETAREGVALTGGLAAVAIILALTWRRGLEPVSVVLAGMMVALMATSASAALILANGEYMFSLFIWGGGSLAQQSWHPTLTILTRLAIGAGAAMLLMRPLAILGLDDSSARSLGVAIHATRFAIIGVGVWLASTVVAEVGVIGFVGLAAPALARLSGAHSLKARMIAAPLIGAILLWLTDSVVQLLAGAAGERLPTGAATALLGGPLLLWLLPRLRMFEWPSIGQTAATPRRAARPWLVVGTLAALFLLAIVIGLMLGRGPEGWSVATGSLLADLAELRWPRVALAASAGAMLAACGLILQKVTGNPLASPEILGVGTGAGVGMAIALFAFPAGGLAAQLAMSALGALVTLAVLLFVAGRSRFGPERLLLGGIAMGALGSAVLTAIIATGSPQAFELLRWLTGSTNGATPAQAYGAIIIAALLILPLPFIGRWLAILPLGHSAAGALGLSVARSRAILLALCGLLTGAAALLAGPLSFVGLIAPHLARLIGLGNPLVQGIGAILIGAGLMVISDWLARMVAFPYQLPLGLFAAILGGPYLIWLLGRGVARQ
jgi:iron complex transport system permease protein